MMPRKSSLYPFIGIAVILHVALGLTLFQSESQLIVPSQQGEGISVTLINNTFSVRAEKVISPKAKTTNPVKHKQDTKNSTNNTSKTNTPHKSALTKQQFEAADNHQKNIASITKIIGHIQKQVQHHFYYPRIARLKNWQGTVILKLDIEKTGYINAISISTSSGHNVLDNAALDAVSNIKNNNFLAHLVNKQQSIQLPIVYQLTTG